MAKGKRKTRVDLVSAFKDMCVPLYKLLCDFQCKTTHRTAPQVASILDEEEWLVPIRVDWEHEGVKIRDTFTWNMRGALFSR